VDFNRNLTEQFGDNFKALDASVKRLVEWQEQYRAQLEQLHKLYDQSVQSTTNIDAAVVHVAESTSSIPQSMERLNSIIETADHQLAELERHLDAFQKMRDQAIDAVPQVQAHVEQMANDMTESVRKASEHYKTLLDVSDDYIEAQNQLTQEMLAALTQAGQQVQNDTQTVQQQVADSIQQMQQQAQNSLNETVTALNQSVEDLHQKMEQSVEANVNARL
jgi:septation ring formation regulator EzrA